MANINKFVNDNHIYVNGYYTRRKVRSNIVVKS